jgi:predicted GTPase
MIQDAEEALQATEIVDAGTLVLLVFDATPRQGDAFNVIARFVHKTGSGKVHVAQRLIHFAFLEKSMDANHVCAELSKALNKRRI